MKRLIIILVALMMQGCASPSVSVGLGYKLNERVNYTDDTSARETARIKIYWEHGDVTYGIDHHSQLLKGAPFNNDHEYGKTELFIDVKIL